MPAPRLPIPDTRYPIPDILLRPYVSESPLPPPHPHELPRRPPAEWSRRGVVRLVAIVVAAALLPLLWRPAMSYLSTREAEPSYLPALEASRVRTEFRPGRITDLQRVQPSYVFIGDSMLGTRIDAAYLASLIGQDVMFLDRAGTGSAYWYLAFKNLLIPSGVRPKVVFFFFRDLNMTDPLFRLTGNFPFVPSSDHRLVWVDVRVPGVRHHRP